MRSRTIDHTIRSMKWSLY